MRGGAACERHRGGWHIAAAVPKAAKGTKRNRAKRDMFLLIPLHPPVAAVAVLPRLSTTICTRTHTAVENRRATKVWECNSLKIAILVSLSFQRARLQCKGPLMADTQSIMRRSALAVTALTVYV